MEYSYQFSDNISSGMYNGAIEGTLKWIKDNREKEEWAKDPNAYEMTNLFLFGGKYAQEKKDINLEAIQEMWEIRSQDFKNCNISENYFCYQICKDSYEAAMQKKTLVNDENSHHALRKMAGLGLFFKQQQRDEKKLTYNNPEELLQLIQASKTLKSFHPDLFEKYKFSDNIKRITEIQFEQNLPNEMKNIIQTQQKELLENEKQEVIQGETKKEEIEK